MLLATVNAPRPETTASIAGAYAAHQARTHRGNTAYAQAVKTFLARFPDVQDWADRPLEERLGVNPALRPFLTFLILTWRLQPGYDYLLGRKFSSIWRDLVGSGRTLNDLTPADFDDLTAACVARQECTGMGWQHYRDSMPGAWQVLFHLSILRDPASASHRLSTAERLASVPEPLRDALVRYLYRKSVTCVPGTITGLTTRLLHFGRIVTALDPTLSSLAELDRCRHIEPYLIAVSREVSSKTGLRLSKADQARRIQAISNFLSEITEWGWPDAPPRRLLFRSDVPRLPRPLPRYLLPDADRPLAEQLARSDTRLAADALLLQRACGLRIGELLDLEMDCVHEVPGNGSWLKVPLGKFDTERMVPLDDDTLDLLDRISNTRSAGRPLPNPRTGHPADFLFTHHGHRLSQNAVRSELTRAGEAAGLGKLTPHQLRHTYATALVNAGVSLQALMALLGHVSAQMSLRYGQLFDSTIRTEYERALDLAKTHIGPMITNPTTAGRTALPQLPHRRHLHARPHRATRRRPTPRPRRRSPRLAQRSRTPPQTHRPPRRPHQPGTHRMTPPTATSR